MALLFVLPACNPAQPLRIGFVDNLNGPSGELGVHVRDAVILAFEQQNAKGGRQRRPLELLIKNCPRDPDAILAVNREVLDAGVVAVLGLTTSDMATVAVGLYNKRKVVLISPTAATTDLTGIDDYFSASARIRGRPARAWAPLPTTRPAQPAWPRWLTTPICITPPVGTGRSAMPIKKRGGKISDYIEVNTNGLHSYVQVAEDLLAGNPRAWCWRRAAWTRP